MSTTINETLGYALDQANPNTISDCLQLAKLGTILTPIKLAATQSSATTMTLNPPALMIQSVRVTAGAAAAGLRQIGDSGATASATVCKISDDGITLTFEAGVTAATILYMPQSFTPMSSAFPPTAT